MAAGQPIALRPMLPTDAPVLAAIFAASIEELTADDYTPGQRSAWAAAADDEQTFARHLAGSLTLVATIEGAAVGFAALKAPDGLDMLYVHPDAAGQGVAATLCEACERLAMARGAHEITVQASDTAQGFFSKRGYEARQRGTVARGDEWLGRTEMRKRLDARPASN